MSWSTSVLRGAPFAYPAFDEPLDNQPTCLTSRACNKDTLQGTRREIAVTYGWERQGLPAFAGTTDYVRRIELDAPVP
ncbi:hypothetical protein ACFV2X_53900 [Streptomyces sp. NPDC059679]|uniref:hypothetical protein n=1 Tax=Streptomyces sp. NPDC059679 TaxID=3346903 RepID=UPI003680BF3E